jgi:hypothetical protein
MTHGEVSFKRRKEERNRAVVPVGNKRGYTRAKPASGARD